MRRDSSIRMMTEFTSSMDDLRGGNGGAEGVELTRSSTIIMEADGSIQEPLNRKPPPKIGYSMP